ALRRATTSRSWSSRRSTCAGRSVAPTRGRVGAPGNYIHNKRMDQLQKKFGFENPFRPDPLVRRALRFCHGGKRLLDVGCGEGADSVFYARHGFEVTAIDKNERYLKRFRSYRRAEKIPGIRILERDALEYRYPP